ncbi:glucose 1-dehydrogenase [Cryptosporangium sp. NPDC048952]|uniref:glucose 1-dehydrogenase n=1 Tax=Cryptosporangium sp. NPDC048952 TaxID=3363961 RepID=UPI00371809B0
MPGEFTGKAGIVTGGAGGIGRAIVEHFVREGMRVVVADVDRERGEALAAKLAPDALFTATDVSDPEQIKTLVDVTLNAFGGLDVMVNNAAISGPMFQRFLDDDLAAFHRILGVNLLGVMAGTQAAARHMAGNGGGSIVNVSSIGGVEAGARVLTYRASKAAVIHFTKSAAIDLGEHGVRVNCITPGGIPTELLGSAANGLSGAELDDFIAGIRRIQAAGRPLNRAGVPEDVAEAAAYLAGDRARYLTGAVLQVDGGTAAGKYLRKVATR